MPDPRLCACGASYGVWSRQRVAASVLVLAACAGWRRLPRRAAPSRRWCRPESTTSASRASTSTTRSGAPRTARARSRSSSGSSRCSPTSTRTTGCAASSPTPISACRSTRSSSRSPTATARERPAEVEHEDGVFSMTSRADEFVHGAQTYVFTYTLENVDALRRRRRRRVLLERQRARVGPALRARDGDPAPRSEHLADATDRGDRLLPGLRGSDRHVHHHDHGDGWRGRGRSPRPASCCRTRT